MPLPNTDNKLADCFEVTRFLGKIAVSDILIKRIKTYKLHMRTYIALSHVL
jgi:hypothetical protein